MAVFSMALMFRRTNVRICRSIRFNKGEMQSTKQPSYIFTWLVVSSVEWTETTNSAEMRWPNNWLCWRCIRTMCDDIWQQLCWFMQQDITLVVACNIQSKCQGPPRKPFVRICCSHSGLCWRRTAQEMFRWCFFWTRERLWAWSLNWTWFYFV